jgi:hypothetical protein
MDWAEEGLRCLMEFDMALAEVQIQDKPQTDAAG